MRKKPVIVSASELEEILDNYFDAGSSLNYAVKILGHPGIGKSAIVRQVAERKNRLFIDTRLAFKENVDLGGYPVPDHDAKRMVYYRPKFIPPEKVPEGRSGIVWFLDESNRAHPTVIQTLFQIITERTCGEHLLPEGTSIVLAGNLGEGDDTTITQFDDSALDGRLAVFQLRPSAEDWLAWADREGVHPSIIRYLSLFPERLWDEENINPNPRGWHQVSLAVTAAYGLDTAEELASSLRANPDGPLARTIHSLVGVVAGSDFMAQLTAPRLLSTSDVLAGREERLAELAAGTIPAEDVLWALSGAVMSLKETSAARRGDLGPDEMGDLANVLLFIGAARADMSLSFFYLLLRDCGIFTRVPAALRLIRDEKKRDALFEKFGSFIETDDEG
ncbi:MAG TPA: hypothetical protein PLA65_18445 [Spirochaetota bacterium]|nr:hypothetical protein [Spirochaetota bacterium]HOD13845.1 hypothetical protein [Spirochaetota bacterium]HPG51923.1 hypothetical protein [Spirochaetota bacterium]HPN14046.1 hypothetical protein [Spirochaetota bacterium]